MAADMKSIKLRIKSVQGTMQITKAMELVASSKMCIRDRYYIVSDLLSNFGNELCAIIVDLNGILQCRQFIVRKSDVQYRTNDLHYLANVFFTHLRISFIYLRFLIFIAKRLPRLQQSP